MRTTSERICDDGYCPVCKHDAAMIDGPRGGLCVNVMCRYCGTRLNLTRIARMVEWTHGPQPDIWGGLKATVFPDEATVRAAMEETWKRSQGSL